MLLNPSPHEQIQTAHYRLDAITRYVRQHAGSVSEQKMAEFSTEAGQHYKILIQYGQAQRADLDKFLRSIGAK